MKLEHKNAEISDHIESQDSELYIPSKLPAGNEITYVNGKEGGLGMQ